MRRHLTRFSNPGSWKIYASAATPPSRNYAMKSSEQHEGVRIVSSEFLDPNKPRDNLAVVVLNWKLPSITPLLIEKCEN